MEKMGINFIKRFCLVLLSFVFLSCTRSQKSNNAYTPSIDAMHLDVKDVENSVQTTNSEQKMNRNDLWHGDDGCVCVLFGYGFNDDTFYNEAIEKLDKEYGLEENGGLILPVKFPDDLKSRISNLRSFLDGKNIRGLILLGAPEDTYKTISNINDDWDGMCPYPIYSFFPQDDILGEEAVCNFIIEYERSAEDEVSTEGMTQKIDEQAEDLILSSVRYIMISEYPLPSDSDLHKHVQNIAGKRKIRRYTDQDTGLQSINHFIIED